MYVCYGCSNSEHVPCHVSVLHSFIEQQSKFVNYIKGGAHQSPQGADGCAISGPNAQPADKAKAHKLYNTPTLYFYFQVRRLRIKFDKR